MKSTETTRRTLHLLERRTFLALASGGLLAAVPREVLDALLRDLEVAGTLSQAVIGEVTSDAPGRVRLV